jgi:shikimate kinase/3-dehydroquinate synthase
LATALNRHLVLIGFMGAGKSTLGREVAGRLGRPFYDVDDEIELAKGPIWDLFEEQGEAAFRELEAQFVRAALDRREPSVIAVGGGAVETRDLLSHDGALVVHLEAGVDTCWSRVQRSRRPLARDEAEFRARYERRLPLYREAADASASDPHGVILAAGGVVDELPPLGPLELVADERLVELHEPPVQGPRHLVPGGEGAKTASTVDRLWRELRLDRAGTLVAFGGGCTTDVAGFVAATYLRGVAWVAVPTTLVGQVDAAIGGKTAVNLPEGKNLVGAFHWPEWTVLDPRYLGTLPPEQRLEGMAEVVKTGLLADELLWELEDDELVRRCAAFKVAVCLRDPYDEGPRNVLNLGHTFAHALEAGSNGEVTHGRAVALGLQAALRLSERPTDVVDEVLRPQPVRADRERAWAALQRDKKSTGGELTLVLLGDEGGYTATVPADDVRRALDGLIAQ